MIGEILEDANLVIRLEPWLELASCLSYSQTFLSLCKDIKVVVGCLKIMRFIFELEVRDHNFVLRQLFLNLIKFNQDYN